MSIQLDLKKLKAKLDNNELTNEDIMTIYNIIERNDAQIKDANYLSAFQWMKTEPLIELVDTKMVYAQYFNWCNANKMRPLNPNMIGRILNSKFGFKSMTFTIEGKSVRRYIRK